MHIIAGTLKGRKLEELKGHDIRPTSGMVRGAVFNILAHAAPPEGANVADICCGSGALGFEALSRGADAVTFVDSVRKSLDVARANAQKFGVEEQCSFMPASAENLPLSHKKYSLVFLDPPYGKNLVLPTMIALKDRGWLEPGAVVVAEMADRDIYHPLDGFAVFKEREHGRTKVVMARFSDNPIIR